ncbi:MAG: hypothetical protein MJE77_00520 [Proteobacteria bacterium]|nr:hypothetical protein [Pseudomonadota bacterium]
MLETLNQDSFSRHLNETFRVHLQPGQSPLHGELVEVNSLRTSDDKHGRDPFSIIFRCDVRGPVNQGICKVEHDDLGVVEVFLVPIGRAGDGVRFEAVFA